MCTGEGGGVGTLLPFNIFLDQFPKFCQLLSALKLTWFSICLMAA